MVISRLLVRHKAPDQRFAPGVFVALTVAFAILGQTRPIIGLAGLGTTLVIAGALVELNRRVIWENYRKAYRKQKGVAGLWTKPDPVYYAINIVILWPFIVLLGVLCLWSAYMLS